MKNFSLRQKHLLEFLLLNNILSYKKSKKISSKKLDKIFDNLSDFEVYKANEFILKKTASKKYNYLYCNDIGRLSEKESIFDYKNLYEWDKKWWLFQKKSLNLNDENFIKSKWFEVNFQKYDYLYMQGEWFRWIEKNEFNKKEMYYGSLESLHSYILSEISSKIEAWIDKKIPNEFITEYGKSLFQKVEGEKYYTMNSTIVAGGKEKELEFLKKLFREDFPFIQEKIKVVLEPFSGFTFSKLSFDEFKSKETIENATKIMIIGGFKAAKKISFKTFLQDFYQLKQPWGIIDNLIEDIWNDIVIKYLNKWEKEI